MSETLDTAGGGAEIQRQISELTELSFGLIDSSTGRRIERVERNKEVAVNGTGYTLNQSVDINRRTPLPTDEELLFDTWFMEHVAKVSGFPGTTLSIGSPNMYAVRGGGKMCADWFVPAKDDLITTSSNIVLLDPHTDTLIYPDDSPGYSDKWDEVVGWIISELNEGVDVTHVRAWANYDLGDESLERVEDSRYNLLDVARYRQIKADTPGVVSESNVITMLLTRLGVDTEGVGDPHCIAKIEDGSLEVTDFSDPGDGETLPAQEFDPEFTDRLVELVKKAA